MLTDVFAENTLRVEDTKIFDTYSSGTTFTLL